MDQEETQNQVPQQDTGTQSEQATPSTESVTPNGSDSSTDTAGNEVLMGVLAYILFLIPLLAGDQKNAFIRYHTNQGLVLFILAMILWVVDSVLYTSLFFFVMPLISLLQLGVLVLAIIGIINAAQKHMKPLPLIGHFKILN